METNKEHYAKEIVEIALNCDYSFGLVNCKLYKCTKIACSDCQFCGACACNRKKWANEEYREPVPKLTELEIEELTYFSHHGAVEIQNSFNVGYTFKRWGIYYMENGKLVFDRFIECDYKSLDPRKTYNIKDLLEGQNVK